MKIRVLGCYGGELLGRESSAFIINDVLFVDAGSTGSLTIHELSKIRCLALSHAHLDHIKGLPFLAEQLAEGGEGIEVLGMEETLDALKKHIFNWSIWPDLSRLPAPENPALKYTRLVQGIPHTICGLTIRAIPVNHTVPSAGFIISDDNSSILYSGDTGPTEELWGEANKTPNLKALMIEVSYPSRLHERALLTRHLTPHLFREEMKKIHQREGMSIYIYHLKPLFVDEIRKELSDLKINNLVLLEDGDSFQI